LQELRLFAPPQLLGRAARLDARALAGIVRVRARGLRVADGSSFALKACTL
jgi:hypothetical protein